MTTYKIFKPTTQTGNTKSVYGFDVETYGQKNKFYCASLVGSHSTKTFFSKDEMIEHLKLKRFKNSYIVATNLGFDFNALFYGHKEVGNFDLLSRGSDLLSATTSIKHCKFFNRTKFSDYKKEHNIKERKPCKLTFIDTMNFAHLSVAGQGKLLGLPKLVTPSFINPDDDYWRKPQTKEEIEELVVYNRRDADISRRFFNMLQEKFFLLGASPRVTIASTSMSVFKNKYLSGEYVGHSVPEIKNMFKAYYGGRVEAVARGVINKDTRNNKQYKLYDYNSLYPSVMYDGIDGHGAYPDPNSLENVNMPTMNHVDKYEGVTKVTIKANHSNYPLLPLRSDGKLLFPTGTFTGWYSNLELRRALDLGYQIKKMYSGIIFKDLCYPFRDFVKDLYEQRMKYKREGNKPMSTVLKIILNSHYGKYGERTDNKTKLIHKDAITLQDMDECEHFEPVGDYFRLDLGEQEPKSHSFPEWALYTTALGRLKLHDGILKSSPVYYDTDSLITTKDLDTSSKLGRLKLEHTIKEGIIVKPKMYAYVNGDDKEIVKFKGVNTKGWEFDEFYKFLGEPVVNSRRFVKMREALRRGLTPNEILNVTKALTLEDTKRVWIDPFNRDGFEQSFPTPIF